MATRRKFRARSILLLLFALLAGVEILLRVVDFRYEPDTEFSYPRPIDFAQVQYDPELFWKLKPGTSAVNAWGFPGDEIVVEKPAGTYRILFFGDSIMEAGYPAEVETCLQEAGVTGAETIPLAVRGFSSYQGRILAEKYGRLLNPDLVVVQFGWNDHWLAFGEPDAEKSFTPPPAASLGFYWVYDRVRVLQGVSWVWGGLSGQGNDMTGERRVPPEVYRDNLQEIRAFFEQENIPVVFVTAPSTHKQFGVPDDLIKRRFARDAASLLHDHEMYNAIVRKVAGEKLMDVAAALDSYARDDLRRLFQSDGIHPTRAGTEEIATIVCESIFRNFP